MSLGIARLDLAQPLVRQSFQVILLRRRSHVHTPLDNLYCSRAVRESVEPCVSETGEAESPGMTVERVAEPNLIGLFQETCSARENAPRRTSRRGRNSF